MRVVFLESVPSHLQEAVRKLPVLEGAEFHNVDSVSNIANARKAAPSAPTVVFLAADDDLHANITAITSTFSHTTAFALFVVTTAETSPEEIANYLRMGAFEVIESNANQELIIRRLQHAVVQMNAQDKVHPQKRARVNDASETKGPTGVDLTLSTVEGFVAKLHQSLSETEVKEKMSTITDMTIRDRPLSNSRRNSISGDVDGSPSQERASALDIHCGLLLEQALLLPNRIPTSSFPCEVFDLNCLTNPEEILQDAKGFRIDVWKYSHEQLLCICYKAFEDLGLISDYKIEPSTLMHFLKVVKGSYHGNPYHNFEHAIDVTMNVYGFLCLPTVSRHLQRLDFLALMVSAIVHDIDHRGCNNAFEVNTCSALALKYNDISVLENHHVSFLFTLFRYPEYNIISAMSMDEYREVRRIIIKSILATDMVSHYESLGNFVKRLDSPDSFTSPASKEDRQIIINLLLHFADICNACKPWEIHKKWQDVLLDEFFVQGDKEKALGLKVSNFCDRDKPEPTKLAVNFMDHFVTPIFSNLARFAPELNDICGVVLAENRERWLGDQIAELHSQMNEPASDPQPAARPSGGRPF
eukprot:TRINITY_DN4827_c0_g1_i1.p1 TRINITY_DN4827_c0_g1~~TRINITY_DN4827_c0_g1_i1.p1  ORF type:complete len:586 (+),score=106.82 TRINITY_DN4827_c0_g1_i1:68-1825(+)